MRRGEHLYGVFLEELHEVGCALSARVESGEQVEVGLERLTFVRRRVLRDSSEREG